eukprot:TRINITY_DN10373_c0_g1_i2.p3 TRINITY_DN10373_c0_g1~~TRINITY_DN10373_c0_g1_i2.p3  ORF type:complete len:214 (-),score=86.61 TRINITY_DN10373_c0_g1_i2:1306-1947(-)
MSVVLTEELVIEKTQGESLQSVRILNLWGRELVDLSILRKMPMVEVLSLSMNQIKTLEFFSHCPRLRELFLRKNSIEDIRELRYLRRLDDLRVLWLQDNPCCEVDNYRIIVISEVPQVEKLDNVPVTMEERKSAESLRKRRERAAAAHHDRVERGKDSSSGGKRGGSGMYASGSIGGNVVNAVLSLLNVLGPEDLELVKAAAEERWKKLSDAK